MLRNWRATDKFLQTMASDTNLKYSVSLYCLEELQALRSDHIKRFLTLLPPPLHLTGDEEWEGCVPQEMSCVTSLWLTSSIMHSLFTPPCNNGPSLACPPTLTTCLLASVPCVPLFGHRNVYSQGLKLCLLSGMMVKCDPNYDVDKMWLFLVSDIQMVYKNNQVSFTTILLSKITIIPERRQNFRPWPCSWTYEFGTVQCSSTSNNFLRAQ